MQYFAVVFKVYYYLNAYVYIQGIPLECGSPIPIGRIIISFLLTEKHHHTKPRCKQVIVLQVRIP